MSQVFNRRGDSNHKKTENADKVSLVKNDQNVFNPMTVEQERFSSQL